MEVPAGAAEFVEEHRAYLVAGGLTVCGVLVYAWVRRWFAGGVCTSRRRLQGKTVLITGANCGIGRETAEDLAGRGARVLLGCRNVSAGNDAAAAIRSSTGNGDVEVYELNLANLESVRGCAREVLEREDRIDILINNAGVMTSPRHMKTDDGFDLQMGTNHLGHFLLTNLLLDRIKQSAPARIVNVASILHKDAPKDFLERDIFSVDGLTDVEIYGRSKMANIMFSQELHRRLQGTGVTVYALHPGVITTNLFRHIPYHMRIVVRALGVLGLFKSARQGAQTNIYCAVQEGIEEQSGKYFADCAVKEATHPYSNDAAACRKLWDISADIVGL